MKERTIKNISLIFAFLGAIAFLARFGKIAILRAYIDIGIGSCKKIPILCKEPWGEMINPRINKEYILQLRPYVFKDIKISMPKGFTVSRGEMNKAYYKKWRQRHKGGAAYLLYEGPDFFVGLFPQLVKEGVKNDYDFLTRTMYARTDKINNLTDTFFVIMKSIFTPDIGDENTAILIKFVSEDRSGFINYNLGPRDNYFDCNIINSRGDFFKVYIKDKGAQLDLDKVFAIISTVNPAPLETFKNLGKN